MHQGLTAQHENAIKHAVIALGTLHERFLNSYAEGLGPAADFAMKDVVTLDTHTSARATDVALTVSIVFAASKSLKSTSSLH